MLLRSFLIGFSFLFMRSINAQENFKYYISFHNLNSSNFDQTKNLLERVTQSTSIEFDKIDSVFTITTNKSLDKNVVSGKMLKNYYPIRSFIKEGEQPEPFPKLINTDNPEQDLLIYEEKKNNWVKKYPQEYKKMTEASVKQN